ncbi:hypothetical protein CK203_086256 [Vitis vinifera]|uniref:Uncharacterized protein n=1 Tax=Vitis vinifera TaxID=29760 RepID=A0A438EE60_VITVI|nr:hypothetical protein CK203_086256 [Vitis vinifera]
MSAWREAGGPREKLVAPGEEEAVSWWRPNLSRFWLRRWRKVERVHMGEMQRDLLLDYIRRGELTCLLDGVETCCRESKNRDGPLVGRRGTEFNLSRGEGTVPWLELIGCEVERSWRGPIRCLSGSQRTKDLTRERGGSKVPVAGERVELKSYADAVKISPRRVGQSVWLEVGKRGGTQRWGVSVRIQALKKSGAWKWSFPALSKSWWDRDVTPCNSGGSFLLGSHRWCRRESQRGGCVRGGEDDGGSQREKVEQWRVQQGRLDVLTCRPMEMFLPPLLWWQRREKGAGFGLDGLAAVAGEAISREGPLDSLNSRPRASSTSLEVEAFGVADQGDDLSRPRAQARSLARGVSGDVDPFVGMSRDPKPLEVSEVGRGEMTNEALRVEASSMSTSLRFLWGGGALFFFSSSGFVRAGAKEAASAGLIAVNEGDEQLPLSIILADGSTGEMDTEGEKSIEVLYRIWKKEEIGGTTVVWRDSVTSWVFRRMELKGAAGGVVVFWDKRVLELVDMEVGLFSISCRFKNCEDGFLWVFSGVERSREGRITGSMRRFSEVIEELALRDLPIQGGPFTWTGGLNGHSSLVEGVEFGSFRQNGVNKRLALDKKRERRLRRISRNGAYGGDFMETKVKTDLAEGRGQEHGIFSQDGKFQQKKNCLKKIKVNGNWLSEEQEIQRGVVRAFQSLLSDPGGWRPSVNNLEFDSIGAEEAARLELMFTVEEVFLALSELNGDKAPGPDGFTLAFWHFCWDFVKDEIMGRAEDLTDFRPISLVGSLYKLLAKGSERGYLSGCRIRGREGAEIRVSHLLFADDALVFCEDSQEQLAFLSWLLLWFETTSGLRINLNKSEILPVGRVENAELLAAELGCKVGSLPSTYLGLPLGASHKSVMVWDGMEERMRKRLALWKRQFISKGGRITLIRSTLASMPTYLMSLMRMPRVVKLRLEKIQRDFLWGGGGWCTCGVGRATRWGFGKKSARKGCCCSTMFLFSVGDGKRVRFWKDTWCGNTPLCEAYPSLFDLAVSKDAKVADCWDSMGEVGGWNPRFLRPFNDWEVEEVEEVERFLLIIQGKRLNADLEDRMVWKETKDGFSL